MSQSIKSFDSTKISKSNNTKKKWTQNEIDLLTKEFKNGTKIKLIASKLGKTETAVNKFLTRCGIRPKTKTLSRNNYLLNNEHDNNTTKDIQSNITSPGWIRLLNDFVDFQEVIKYLKSKNYNISDIIPENIKMFYPNSKYMLNGKPVSKAQLLIVANKLRKEENKNIFKIAGII